MFDGCSIFAKYQLPLGDDPPMEWLCRPVIVLNVGGVFLILPQLPEGHQLKKGGNATRILHTNNYCMA